MLKILYATDGSAAAEEALRFLETLPLAAGTAVQALFALGPPIPPASPYGEGLFASAEVIYAIEEREEAFAKETLEAVQRRLGKRGPEVTPQVTRDEPSHAILKAADAWEADLVVVGSKGLTGLSAFLLGSTARNVAKHSRRPVLVARAPQHGLRGAVLGTDGSEHARHAVQLAARLPLPKSTRWTTVHVVRPYSPFSGLLPTDQPEFDAAVLQVRRRQEEGAGAVAAEAQARLMAAGHPARAEVRSGDPAAEILQLAEERDADLIVIGARGVSPIEGLLVGSAADRILKEARRSVLIVP